MFWFFPISDAVIIHYACAVILGDGLENPDPVFLALAVIFVMVDYNVFQLKMRIFWDMIITASKLKDVAKEIMDLDL